MDLRFSPPKRSPSDPNPSQLRDAIDRGQTQDKVPVSDPAAAPLGTDDEAAGVAPSSEQAKEAIRSEQARPTTREHSRKATVVIATCIVLSMILTGLAVVVGLPP